jgi:hypothetical protein
MVPCHVKGDAMFRTKDLVITVVPQGVDVAQLHKCLWTTRICIRPTFGCFPWTCAQLSCRLLSGCGVTFCQWNTPCGPISPCQLPTFCGPVSPCGVLSPCGALSPCGGFSPCPLQSNACPIGTQCGGVSPVLDDTRTQIINPAVFVVNEVADIKALRGQLDELQSQLGEFEEKGLDYQPMSAEEIANLEGKLKGALEELAQRRKGGK